MAEEDEKEDNKDETPVDEPVPEDDEAEVEAETVLDGELDEGPSADEVLAAEMADIEQEQYVMDDLEGQMAVTEVQPSRTDLQRMVEGMVESSMNEHDQKQARLIMLQLGKVAAKIDNFGYAVRRAAEMDKKYIKSMFLIEQQYERNDMLLLICEDITGIPGTKLMATARTRYNAPVRRKAFFKEVRGEMKASTPYPKGKSGVRLGDYLVVGLITIIGVAMLTKIFGLW